MAAFSAEQVVRAWESAEAENGVEKALSLLSIAHPEKSTEELANLSIGRRDARLLDIRDRIFGGTLQAFAECPECAGRLEYALSSAELRGRDGESACLPLRIESEGFSLLLRLVNSTDLAAASRCERAGEARRMLAERCVLEATRDGGEAFVSEIPDTIIGQIAETLSRADPLADLTVDLRCPTCGHRWEVMLDIAAFLWPEVKALAKRLLREVHVLAQAYGWHEADILSMSSVRRQFYLEMAR